MNINQMIRDLLESKGCRIEEDVGIWTVTTPAGKKWDFTNPQLVPDQYEPVEDTRLEDD